MKKIATRIFLSLLIGFSHFIFHPLQANNDSDSLQVSLLTCGPGTDEAYQSFGHTAIRVRDLRTGTDKVFNYGVFDFNTDGFYMKFIQGKLLYYVDIERFDYFVYNYMEQNRWVREQILNLEPEKKQQLYAALEKNALPENKFYLYDFTHNNCSTQPRDLIEKTIGADFQFKEMPKANTGTFRQMIDSYMYYNEWMDFGIDLLLGRPLDEVADNKERMFLPEELMAAFDSATYKGQPLVQTSSMIYEQTPIKNPYIPGPALAAWIIVAILIIQQTRGRHVTQARGIGFVYFFITGAVGCILLFMWFGTDHVMTKWNFNLLWAFPLHLPMSFWLLRRNLPSWVKSYFFFFRILLLVMVILWAFKPQEFHMAVLPISLIGVWCVSKFYPVPKVLEQPV